MALRKIACVIPSRDGCGLARSFRDAACPDGIPPHVADTCRRCAAVGIIPGTPARARLPAVTGWIRRFVPFGPICQPTPALPAAGHRESITFELLADQEGLLGALDDDFLPGRMKGATA